MCVGITVFVLCMVTCSGQILPLKDLTSNKGAVRVLSYEPSPEDFYENFVYASVPVLIRTRSPTWSLLMEEIGNVQQINRHVQGVFGKAYTRPIWTEGWPLCVQLNFSSYYRGIDTNKLYWDSNIPMNCSLLKHIPLPYSFQCAPFIQGLVPPNLLVTNQKSTSVFHQDGSENFFYQIEGTKTWLIANHSYSRHAYADHYGSLQAGMSPLNPEAVDLNKYPLAADIKFLVAKTQPGDLLYVPQYWWHHVTSDKVPNVAVNLWFDMFSDEGIEDSYNVSAYVQKFADLRETTPNSISCPLQSIPANAAYNKVSESAANVKESSTDVEYLIFFGCDDGAFYALSSKKGEVRWKYQTTSDAGSTPVLSKEEHLVYFAGEDAFVYAIDIKRGALQWKYRLGDGVTSALRLSPDGLLLFVVSLDQYVYAFDAELGKLAWKQGPLGGELWASPYVSSRYLIVCSMLEHDDSRPTSNTVFKINSQTGEIEWSYSSGNSVFASPAVDEENSRVFVFSYDGKVHTIDLKSGERLWEAEVGESGEASPAYDPKTKRLYAMTRTGSLVCFETIVSNLPATVAWSKRFSDSTEVISSPLLVPKQNALYAAIGNHIYRMSSLDGKIDWSFASTSSFMSSPRMDKYGTLYIGGLANEFFAINAANGELKWSVPTNGPVVGSVTLPQEVADQFSYGALL